MQESGHKKKYHNDLLQVTYSEVYSLFLNKLSFKSMTLSLSNKLYYIFIFYSYGC